MNVRNGRTEMKQYINSTLIYAILAMLGGVFYREFTRINSFTGQTTLGVIHTHYFVLGMIVFLLLLLLEKNFSFTKEKTRTILVAYHVGLNLTVAMLMVRGIIQVQNLTYSSGISSMISGIAGVGHILLTVSLIALLIQIKKNIYQPIA